MQLRAQIHWALMNCWAALLMYKIVKPLLVNSCTANLNASLNPHRRSIFCSRWWSTQRPTLAIEQQVREWVVLGQKEMTITYLPPPPRAHWVEEPEAVADPSTKPVQAQTRPNPSMEGRGELAYNPTMELMATVSCYGEERPFSRSVVPGKSTTLQRKTTHP